MLYVYTLSPLHCGTGQSVDVIDLPIARERVTNWPVIPGSSLKGPLKQALCPEQGNPNEAHWRHAFGPNTSHADEGAGALSFGDARLLCFPARSYAGSFAWITCPLALRRWQRDYEASGLSLDLPGIPTLESEAMLVTSTSELVVGSKVVLEDLDLSAESRTDVDLIANTLSGMMFREQPSWQQAFQAQFGITSDDVFTFLTETATEVAARVRISEESKTAASGALWYEEAVPPETLFTAPIIESGARQSGSNDALSILPQSQTLQIGGHTTIGRGLVQLTIDRSPR